MEGFPKHLYLILYPNEALVASQLTPDEFGRHYAVGSSKHFSGKVIFAELESSFRNDYFDINHYLDLTDSGMPGVPKKTKFIKSYRVLEHVDLNALLDLYLVTVDGQVLALQQSNNADLTHELKSIRIYQEICPLHLLVASNFTPEKFADYITSETDSKGAPKIFFTQYDVDVQSHFEQMGRSGLPASPLPNVNPATLNTAIMELAADNTKRTKTISLNEIFGRITYLMIKHGFWLADDKKVLFYRLPDARELEEKHFDWWRSVYR